MKKCPSVNVVAGVKTKFRILVKIDAIIVMIIAISMKLRKRAKRLKEFGENLLNRS